MSSRNHAWAASIVVAAFGLGAPGVCSLNAAELAPAEAQLLPATSHVLVGIDVKTFVTSPAYQKLLQNAKEKKSAGASDPLEELRQKTGLDPAKDIDRIVIGAEGEPSSSTGVALIAGRFDAARLGTFLVKEKGVTVKAVGAHKLYLSPSEAPGKPETAAVVVDSGRMLVGPRPSVEKALAGSGAGLDIRSPLVGLVARVHPGAVLWLVVDEKVLAQASGPDAPGGMKVPPLKSLVLSADVAPDLAINLEGDTVDVAGATNLADMLRGFSAMISMQAQQKPELGRLAQALSVTSEATRVTVAIKLPYDLLESLGKSMVPSAVAEPDSSSSSEGTSAKPAPRKPSTQPRVTPASPKPKPKP